jgi:cell division protein FtsI (penicillin-binding protein 3)
VNPGFQQRSTRIALLTILLGGLFILVGTRLAILVLFDGPRLASMAQSEHSSELQLAAVRGPIVDRSGKPLALSAETLSVYARPRQLLANTTAAERERLARVLGLSYRALVERLARKSSFVWLARHVNLQLAQTSDEVALEGLGTVAEYQRFYPERSLAAAVVGKAGVDGQGLSGVELEYDRIARGEPIVLSFYHDALGHPILDSPVGLRNPRPGARLELTIDSAIQAQAETYLADQVRTSGADHGSAVVLDPFTGEVLAMANAGSGKSADTARLHNSAVQDAFEPGSTMKGILAAIALEDGVTDEHRQIFCEHGVWRVAGRMIHDDSPRGWLDLGSIIQISSNIGAAKIALALGAERFHAGLEAFGFGRKTVIDLPGEAAGLMRPAATWRVIELADHGFGQGVAVTPIQLAIAYAAIANGGLLMRPYVVKSARDADGREIFSRTPQIRRRAVSPAIAHKMNLLLRGVVNSPDGTGHLAQVADFTVAGKTGTAQMVDPSTGTYYSNRLVASFVGFVPAQDPRLVILVVLYGVPHAHFGGLVAAPVFSAIASGALRRLDVAPPHQSYETAGLVPGAALAEHFLERDSSADAGDAVEMDTAQDRDPQNAIAFDSKHIVRDRTPDFHGLSLREALRLAREHSLILDLSGDGYVVGQQPSPATRNHGSVKLRLSDKLAARASASGRSWN